MISVVSYCNGAHSQGYAACALNDLFCQMVIIIDSSLVVSLKGAKDNESNINVAFEVLSRAETLKILKFPPEIFLLSIIICTFAGVN